MSYTKVPLKLDLYEKYEISQLYNAWKITFADVNQERLDEIEYDLQKEGHKIFHIETKRVEKGLFEVTFITAERDFTF